MHRNTKQQLWALVFGVALACTPTLGRSQPQDTGAKQDMKSAGHETKDAAQDAGHGVKKGTKKAYHATKRTTKKVWHKTKDTTKGAVDGGKEGAHQP